MKDGVNQRRWNEDRSSRALKEPYEIIEAVVNFDLALRSGT